MSFKILDTLCAVSVRNSPDEPNENHRSYPFHQYLKAKGRLCGRSHCPVIAAFAHSLVLGSSSGTALSSGFFQKRSSVVMLIQPLRLLNLAFVLDLRNRRKQSTRRDLAEGGLFPTHRLWLRLRVGWALNLNSLESISKTSLYKKKNSKVPS